MKKKPFLVLLIVMLIVVAVFCYLMTAGKTTPTVSAERLVSGSAPASPPSHARVRKANPLDIIQAAYNNPITLYGKVVDQNGEPVPNAIIELYPLTSHFQEDAGKNIVLNSDAAGAFSIKGLRGFSMGVSTKKEGYIQISPLGGSSSSTTVSYGNDASTGKRYSNPDTPLVLRLQNPGTMEPMVRLEKNRWKLLVDGTPRLIALDSKNGKGEHQIEFRFKSDWSKLPKNNEMYGKRYDWSFEARIPGGGFIWNDKDFDFTAPENGYRETIRLEFKADMPKEQWQRVVSGIFFVKFADGCHGLISIDVDGGTDWGPLAMKSLLNPKPGSRNLASLYMQQAEFSREQNKKQWGW